MSLMTSVAQLTPLAAAAFAGALALTGCLEPRELPASATKSCAACHGEGDGGAPPPAVWLRGTGDGGVGAHQAHLGATSKISAAAGCPTCHVVPTSVEQQGHMDTELPAEVTLGGLAAARGFKASYDAAKGRCTVYCHGLNGGGVPAPGWGEGTTMACGSCHGLPPAKTLSGASHTASALSGCAGCHPSVVDSAGEIIATDKHINGKVEATAGACNSCHGSKDNDAPPKDTKGNSATSARGVGAHQAHVKANARHAAIACDACHVTPKSPSDSGHNNGTVELVFGKLAKGDLHTPPADLAPVWDTTALTCKTTYCHGLSGGGLPAPTWNKGTTMTCGSCHGLPPSTTLGGTGHVASSLSGCAICHSSVVDSAGAIIDATKHVNGVTDL